MKPFNLEAAMRGEPIVTRDGRKAKFIAYVPEASKYYRVIVFLGNYQECLTYAENGTYLGSGESKNDLFMTDTKNEREFPQPLRDEPAIDQQVWLVDLMISFPLDFYWNGNDYQKKLLKRGILQATKEGAELQRKAMIKSVGGDYE